MSKYIKQKKALGKKNKNELIKLCRQNGLSIDGNKSQLADRLAQKYANKKNKHKKKGSKQLSQTKYVTKINHSTNLIRGYVRRIEQIVSTKVPEEIFDLCIIFCLTNEYLSLLFNAKKQKRKIFMDWILI